MNEAKFNPKEPGPLNVVAHSSGPSYLESRAIEFVMEATNDRLDSRNLVALIKEKPDKFNFDSEKETFELEAQAYKKKMLRAIQCLTLAIIKVENGEF